MKKYYQLFFEVKIDGAWYLSEINDENGEGLLGSHFNQGKKFNQTTKLTVIPNVVGQPVDFRETSFAVPIVSEAFAKIVETFDPNAIQRIPVTVAPNITGFEILNILTKLDCIDYETTLLEKYTNDLHYMFPDKIGQIKGIFDLHVRPEIAKSHHIFRLSEYWVITIISEELKDALEEKNFTGMKFYPA